jgi:hypothetical protein
MDTCAADPVHWLSEEDGRSINTVISTGWLPDLQDRSLSFGCWTSKRGYSDSRGGG